MSSEPPVEVEVKRQTVAVAPIPAVPWWASTNIRWAIVPIAGGVVGIFETLCKLGWFCFPKLTSEALTPGLVGVATMYGGYVWIKKRIASGDNPASPDAKILPGLLPKTESKP